MGNIDSMNHNIIPRIYVANVFDAHVEKMTRRFEWNVARFGKKSWKEID